MTCNGQANVTSLQSFGDCYWHLHGYVSLALCIYGLITNIINITILTKKSMINPINCLLTGRSASSTFSLAGCCGGGTGREGVVVVVVVAAAIVVVVVVVVVVAFSSCARIWENVRKLISRPRFFFFFTLTQRSLSGLTVPLSRNSVGTYQETSSHATRQRTLGHSHLSSLSHCGLILAQKSGISVRELISTLKESSSSSLSLIHI